MQETLAALGLSEYEERFAPHWEESQRAQPDTIAWLEEGYVRDACRQSYVPDDIAEAAVRTAQRVVECEAMRALAWHMHYCVYVDLGAGWDRVTHWPRDFRATLGEDAASVYLLVVLSNLPGMQAEHGKRGIPAEVIRATVLDVKLWLDMTRERTGEAIPNMGPVMLAWLSNHFLGRLYRLVRLQFQFGDFGSPFRAFRHQETKAVLVLSEGDVTYGPDGQRAREEVEGGWRSRLMVDEAGAMGNPVLPTGRAVPREVRLPFPEWQQILAPGDPVFNLHIPGGEPMTHAGCGDSFRMAMEFFPRYYPEYDYRSFVCHSWILNSWLEGVLPAESNLVRFQREVYLFPCHLWPPSMYSRVFGREELPTDLSQLSRKTGLQRVIVEALESGRGVGGGAGGLMLFPEDFDWGAEVYRNQKLPIAL